VCTVQRASSGVVCICFVPNVEYQCGVYSAVVLATADTSIALLRALPLMWGGLGLLPPAHTAHVSSEEGNSSPVILWVVVCCFPQECLRCPACTVPMIFWYRAEGGDVCGSDSVSFGLARGALHVRLLAWVLGLRDTQ